MLLSLVYTEGLRARFASRGYLPLPRLIPPDLLMALRSDLRRLEEIATRRDFAMECMEGSPRHLTTLGGQVIAGQSPLIPALYQDEELIGLLGRISGITPVTVNDLLERHVVNILHRQGDTDGAHTDDYPLALVLFIEAPDSPEDGGLLHYAAHATGLGDLDGNSGCLAHHRPGDGYLLRSDTTAHRVTPLRRPGIRRTVINLAYTSEDRQNATTPSASLLYN